MNYKSIVQYLNFPDYHNAPENWEYLLIRPNQQCHSIQEFAELLNGYSSGIEELKLTTIDSFNWYVMFKKGGQVSDNFPGVVTIGIISEPTDTNQES